MRCFHDRCVRGGCFFILLAALVLTGGCTSFKHDWDKAAKQSVPPNDIQGRWQGVWKSDASGHNDELRCVVTRKDDGSFKARFHAKYKKVLSFGYTVPLKVAQGNGVSQFSGEANLGWWAGGVYHYDGHADGTDFFSTYRCKYDHGIFQMSRPAVEVGGVATAAKAGPLASARQLLVVVTGDWDTVPGGLRRFERADEGSPWKETGSQIPVVVGRNGLGWGRGLNAAANLPGPIKKEGDGKSPAGIFRLSSAFGLAAADTIKGLKLPYQPLTSVIECVDDVKSVHYNSIVDRSGIRQPDWNSSEKMREVGEQYRLGVVVDHNFDPHIAAGGSCIFIHIWKGAQIGTSGCTAMAPDQMEGLLPWLDPAAQPVLVQLPAREYKLLQKDWQLPNL